MDYKEFSAMCDFEVMDEDGQLQALQSAAVNFMKRPAHGAARPWSNKGNTQILRDLLTEYGAKRISELKPEQYTSFYQRLIKL